MTKAFALTASDVATAILVLNLLLFLFRFKRLPFSVRALGYFLALSLLTEVGAQSLFYQGVNNLFLLHIYTVLELLAWSYFYYLLFRGKTWRGDLIPYLVAPLVFLLIANSLLLEPLTGFNSNAKTLVQLTLIGYAVSYLFDAFGKIDLSKPVPRAITFINFAVLLYYSGSLFIFMSSRLLAKYGIAPEQQYALWAVNALLLIIFQLLIFSSLWTAASRKATSS
jgi:hypothetical protein